MAVILDEEKLNEKIRYWMTRSNEEKQIGDREMIINCSIYIDALQDVRKMHGLPRLKGL